MCVDRGDVRGRWVDRGDGRSGRIEVMRGGNRWIEVMVGDGWIEIQCEEEEAGGYIKVT